MTGREGIKKVNEAMIKHPNREVIFMVGEEACPCEYSRSLAGIGYISHDRYLMSDEYGLDEERIYFKSDDEVEEEISEWMIDNEMTEDDFEKAMESLKWVKCIVVYITSP